MIIVADTTPLIALVKINLLYLLKEEYEEIYIPEEVYNEIKEGKGQDVKTILEAEYIKVKSLEKYGFKEILINDFKLDVGESAAIALAKENNADLLLIDEKKGREIAKTLNIDITGTLGILTVAYQQNQINNLKEKINALQNAGIYISDNLKEKIIKEYL